jgi:effector-binding domain-containing protein
MMTVKEHTERFKVTVIGPSTIEPRFYAYVPLQSTQKDKALKMMENYSFLNTILVKNGLKLDGQPFIEIIDWTIEKDSISYNFCYPIVQSDTLPAIKGLEFKKLDERKALKAIYNGNYITSDRAWYHLLEYADKNHIPVKKQPLEIFYSNPNMGGNELDWKAEIFMPLQ